MIPDTLPGLQRKIAAALAVKPEFFVTHPSELHIVRQLTSDELNEFAEQNGWRVVRRVGGRQIEFYNDVTVRPEESGRA